MEARPIPHPPSREPRRREETPVDLPDFLHRIPIPTPYPVGPVNCYLIEGDPLTLLDIGPRMAASRRALEKGLATHGYTVKQVERILISHGHPDHFGQAAEVRRESGAQVWGHPWDQEFLGRRPTTRDYLDFGERAMRYGLPEATWKKIAALFDLIEGLAEPAAPDRWMAELEPIPGDHPLQVFHTPGHCPGQVCLWMEKEQMLLCGDHILRDITPNPFVAALGQGMGLTHYLRSLGKVRGLHAQAVLPGHGSLINDLPATIRYIETHHDQRIQQIQETLTQTPQTPYDISRTLFHDLPLSEVLLGQWEVLSHLEVMVDRGTAVEEENGKHKTYRRAP